MSQQKTVLILQGGGALGAYQAGVYQQLHEAQHPIDWVIGTSIARSRLRPSRLAASKMDTYHVPGGVVRHGR